MGIKGKVGELRQAKKGVNKRISSPKSETEGRLSKQRTVANVIPRNHK